MFKKIVLVAFLVAAGTLGCGSETGPDVLPEDASNNNQETAVVRDAPPSSQPDVAPRDDAGQPNDAVVVTADAPVADDQPMAAPDSGMMVVAFSNATCVRLRTACWRTPGGKTCQNIICEMMPGGLGNVLIPENIAGLVGYERARCSGTSCQLYTFGGMRGDCVWTDLSAEMMRFRCVCPGRPDLVIEADN